MSAYIKDELYVAEKGRFADSIIGKDLCVVKDNVKDCRVCIDKGKDCCVFAKHPEPKGILLECGCHPQDAVFEPENFCGKKDPVFVLDSLIVDATCLCRPLVKIEFSSLVYFEGEAKCGCGKELEVDLLFELVRICKGEKECVQSWRYVKKFEIEYNDKLKVRSSEPFTVTFCDRICPDCCEYKMTVKSLDLDGKIEKLKVIKPNLSALAQGICDC